MAAALMQCIRWAFRSSFASRNEGDRLLDAEPLAFFVHHSRNSLHERRFVGRDDLGELALELLEIFHLRHVPRASHIGLGTLSGFENGFLLIFVELIP